MKYFSKDKEFVNAECGVYKKILIIRKALGILPLLLTVVFSVVSTIAEGAEWKLISKSEDENISVFVDNESIKHISKNSVTVWVKMLFKEPVQIKTKQSKYAIYSLGHEEHDCSVRKIKLLQLTFYYTDSTNDNAYPLEVHEVIPGTIQATTHDYLCKKHELFNKEFTEDASDIKITSRLKQADESLKKVDEIPNSFNETKSIDKLKKYENSKAELKENEPDEIQKQYLKKLENMNLELEVASINEIGCFRFSEIQHKRELLDLQYRGRISRDVEKSRQELEDKKEKAKTKIEEVEKAKVDLRLDALKYYNGKMPIWLSKEWSEEESRHSKWLQEEFIPKYKQALEEFSK